MIQFDSPTTAAQDVREVLDYLWTHHESHFLYRGQTREYPGPLLPSAYRGKHIKETSIAQGSTSMRGIGRRYYEIQRFRNFDDIFVAYSGEDIIHDREEVSLLWNIIHNDGLTRRIGAEGFESALRKELDTDLLKRYEHRLPVWQSVTDAQHKGLLRLNGANQFFGFQVGQTLAQHYIESSEFLDATRSPTVAAFFANYANSENTRRQSRVPYCASENVGIIYRFSAPTIEQPPFLFDYYSAPAFVDAVAVAKVNLKGSALEY